MRIRTLTAVIFLTVAPLIGGCAGIMPDQVTQEPRDDAIIATKIKAQLIEAEDLDAAAINVDSSEGVVTLSGFVETEAQKQQAQTLAAAQVGGSQQIVNNIEVK